MTVTFEQWEDGYLFNYNGNQVAAGLYNGAKGFELLEDSGLTVHSNAMCAFTYLKAKHESNPYPLKQSTIDVFTPWEGSDSSRRVGQRTIAASSAARP